ncbi:serine/threonine-protein kinase [Paludisphaera rhizosphaerae]|uniref:serine/threonine-protein kinase n=1 Tax=Paludisphaera rhizosphaerae TaxID=2711216 RepID=UPI0013ED1BCF|nr:serine/threonine-protein kinase [Paludisphaera rhizosphaerae]
MSTDGACPSDETLRGLIEGSLDPAAFDTINQHVDNCSQCRRQMEVSGRTFSTISQSLALPSPIEGPLPEIPGFEFVKLLGRGGAGAVFLARQADVGRLVAIKVLVAGDGDASARTRTRWIEEATAAASVRHPNVVQLHSWGEVEKLHYLVMEYVPGGDLQRRASSPLPPREAAALVEAVARAVAHLHTVDLLHLDLKPSNILLDDDPDGTPGRIIPKVADFGLSTPASNESERGAGIRGTPSYMAPEQAAAGAEPIGKAADVHALGAILYRLLTGRPPFLGASPQETIEQVRGRDPVPPRLLVDHIPRDLETIALKCLAKDPRSRYSSAAAVAEDLRLWTAGRPIKARPISAASRIWRFARREPRLAVASAALAAAVMLGLTVSIALYRRAERNLATASDVASRLQALVVEMGYGRYPESTRFDTAATEVREGMLRLAEIVELPPHLVRGLSEIEGVAAHRLMEARRLDEARRLFHERTSILRSSRRVAEENPFQLYLCGALINEADCEQRSGRTAEALARLDEAAALVLAVGAENQGRCTQALRIGEGYADIRDAPESQPEESRRAEESRRRILEPLAKIDSARPEMILFRACALVDLGDPSRADEHAAGLTALACPYQAPTFGRRLEMVDATNAWVRREVYRWLIKLEHLEAEDFQHVLARLERLYERAGVGSDSAINPIASVHDGSAHVLMTLRSQGRFDQAERVTEVIMTTARKLVEDRPRSADAHALLAEAYGQRAKNAWKRDNLAGVRSGLQVAIQAAAAGLAVAPDDAILRRQHSKLAERLAGLEPNNVPVDRTAVSPADLANRAATSSRPSE